MCNNNYNNGFYSNKLPYPERNFLRETHVFDEELSVAANKQMVADHNAQIKAKLNEYRESEGKATETLKDDMVKAVVSEYGLTEEQAIIINEFAYREHHSSIFDYMNYLYDYAPLAVELLKAK